MKTRIVLFTRRLDQGGAQRQLVLLGCELKRRGYEVHVVVFYLGGEYESELISAGVPVHSPRKLGRWDVVRFLIHLVACFREIRPNVVYSFLDLPNIVSVFLSYFVGRPRLIWGVRAAFMEMHHYDWLTRSGSWLEARLSFVPDLIIANSETGANWSVKRGFPEQRLVIVENGIDVEHYTNDPEGRKNLRKKWGIEEGTFLVGLVARLDPMKGHTIFLQACAQLLQTDPNMKFVCVGKGPQDYLLELKHLAESLGLSGHLCWIEGASNMPAVYSAFDLLCSSSRFGEGFPNVIGEAMACGVPCVATEVGDSPRIVADLGEVVPPGSASHLAAAILKMSNRMSLEPDLRALLRQRIAKNFSVEAMVSKTCKYIEGRAPCASCT